MGQHRIATVCAALALLLTSCYGVDDEAALTEALNAAVNDQVASATVAETDCITTELMTSVGLERFAEAGIDADALMLDASLLRGGDTAAAVDRTIVSCLDLEARFTEAIANAGAQSFDPDCIAPQALDTEPLTLALVDGDSLANNQADDELATAVVDAVRGCVDETDFAELAGLDSPAALSEVLLADPFAAEPTGSQDACIVEAAVSQLGIERLAELGVTVDSPDFLAAASDLTDEELETFTSSVVACDVVENLTDYVSEVEMQVGACAIERLEDEQVEALVEDAIRGRSLLLHRDLIGSIETCTDEALEAMFGPEPTVASELSFAAVYLGREITSIAGANSYEEACVVRGFLTLVDIETLTAVESIEARFAAGQPITLEEEMLAVEFGATSAELGARCIEPWKRVGQDLTSAGITGDLAECTIERAGEEPARMISDGLPGLIRGEAQGTFDVLDGMDLITEAVGECGTTADVAAWERYLDSIFGLPGSEPAPIEA